MDSFFSNQEKVCPHCCKPFVCGASNGKGCWCMELPPLLPVEAGNQCLCPDCLSSEIKAKLKAEPGKVMAALRKNAGKAGPDAGFLQQGLDYYINQEGNWVFTAFYHLKKGYCCQNGCKHCPYGFKKTEK